MRHGEAVDAYAAASDSQRHLTSRGRTESASVAQRLLERGLVPTHVYTSPFVRAVQTAEVVAHALGLEVEVPAHAPLVPGGPSGPALAVLDAHDPDDRVLLVSHEPTVRSLAAAIGQVDLPPFATSGVAVFEVTETTRLVGRVDPHAGWRGPRS